MCVYIVYTVTSLWSCWGSWLLLSTLKPWCPPNLGVATIICTPLAPRHAQAVTTGCERERWLVTLWRQRLETLCKDELNVNILYVFIYIYTYVMWGLKDQSTRCFPTPAFHKSVYWWSNIDGNQLNLLRIWNLIGLITHWFVSRSPWICSAQCLRQVQCASDSWLAAK